MISTPMVETIARAIYEADPHVTRGGLLKWEDLSAHAQIMAKEQARAALSALSTPTEGMVEAIAEVVYETTWRSDNEPSWAEKDAKWKPAHRKKGLLVWKRLIQAALSEGEA